MFVPGDLMFFVYMEAGEATQTGGIVISNDDALLTVALPHGVEVINMRSPVFGRGWVVEHAPRQMTPEEALAFSRRRLEELSQRPMIVVHPQDEGYRAPTEHKHPTHEHDHHHEHAGTNGHTHS